MKKDKLWNKISRIGLVEGQDVMKFREVILLNRILVVMLGIMCLYVPLEIFINGFALVPVVLLMMIMNSINHKSNPTPFYQVILVVPTPIRNQKSEIRIQTGTLPNLYNA